MRSVQTALYVGSLIALALCVLPVLSWLAAIGAQSAVDGWHGRLDRLEREAASLRKHVRDLREPGR